MAIGLLKIGKLKITQTTIAQQGDLVNDMYVFSGSIDTNLYTDITSNENWMAIGSSNYDYQYCRNQVATWTAINAFSAITANEQIVAATHFSVSKTDRDSVLTDDEQRNAWSSLITNTRNARQSRWTAAKSYISYTLEMPDSINLGKSTTELSNDYIVYGVESLEKSGEAGLFDWIGNTSIYSGGTGYSGKTYWTQSDQDKMLDILKEGNY